MCRVNHTLILSHSQMSISKVCEGHGGNANNNWSTTHPHATTTHFHLCRSDLLGCPDWPLEIFTFLTYFCWCFQKRKKRKKIYHITMTFLLEFMQKISYKKVIKYLHYSSYFPINKLCTLVWKRSTSLKNIRMNCVYIVHKKQSIKFDFTVMKCMQQDS